MRTRLLVGVARKEDLDALYDQVAGLLQVQAAMDARPVLKPLRGWALSPDAMAWILADLQERQAPTVVEFGSGQSTVILALHLKAKGAGRLISFEHDAAYAACIQKQLDACGAGRYAELRVLPLVPYHATDTVPECRSYEVDPAEKLTIDVALIDGPPATSGFCTRLHPLRWALQRLADGGSAYLDDVIRSGERAILARIAVDMPDIVIMELRAEKGLAKCTRRASVS